MTKCGWSEEYLSSKILKYEELYEKETDKEIKETLENELYLYQSMYFKLLSQQGFVVYNKIDLQEFLQEYNEFANVFKYSKSINKKINSITEEFLKLEPIPIVKLIEKVGEDEAIDINLEFIKECFDSESENIFRDFFMKKRDFILFDKMDDIATTYITADDELFASIPKTNNVKMISSIAHESGHIKRILVNKNDVDSNLLIEFESFSYELRLLNWMIKSNIYVIDACKSILRLMQLFESIMITRYYNNRYNLNRIKNTHDFNKMIQDLDLMKKAGLISQTDLLNTISSVLSKNYVEYLYSFLCVMDNLNAQDYLERYNKVIRNLGGMDSLTLSKQILISDITDLHAYKNSRELLLQKINQ